MIHCSISSADVCICVHLFIKITQVLTTILYVLYRINNIYFVGKKTRKATKNDNYSAFNYIAPRLSLIINTKSLNHFTHTITGSKKYELCCSRIQCCIISFFLSSLLLHVRYDTYKRGILCGYQFQKFSESYTMYIQNRH